VATVGVSLRPGRKRIGRDPTRRYQVAAARRVVVRPLEPARTAEDRRASTGAAQATRDTDQDLDVNAAKGGRCGEERWRPDGASPNSSPAGPWSAAEGAPCAT